MRFQLALNVKDLDEAVDYYSKLFGVEVNKRKPGYANFAVEKPPIKLVLFENPNATERLNHVGHLIRDAITFVEQVYIPDLLAIASFYPEWFGYGGGLENYLAYGDLPTRGYNQPEFFKFPRGAILGRNLDEVHEVNGRDEEEIKEYIAHSWYEYGGGDAQGLHPWEGETELAYTCLLYTSDAADE